MIAIHAADFTLVTYAPKAMEIKNPHCHCGKNSKSNALRSRKEEHRMKTTEEALHGDW
nr:MAG TPA: hypothetical protein [Caudoviricetes sp.]